MPFDRGVSAGPVHALGDVSARDDHARAERGAVPEARFRPLNCVRVPATAAIGMYDKAATSPRGARSQDRIAVPSLGNAFASTVRCAATPRWLVRVSATTSHTLTPTGSQPRPWAICLANPRLR